MIAPGSSSYAFADPRGGRSITVQLHRPASFTPESPILVVAHGRLRNGDEYRDYFVPESERRGFLVVAPQFDEAQYPHPHAYNYAGMIDADGRALPRDRWLFPVLRAVFDDVRKGAGSRRDRFFMFGHSAGAQLVHRMATFGWIDSIDHAVAANAGAYTLPMHDQPFPWGVGDMVTDDGLRRLFSRPFTIHLGDKDVDPNDEHLPREPEAMRQGPYRFKRGMNYFETAKREAARLGVPLAWKLAPAPGVGHAGHDMAPFPVPVMPI